MEEATHPGEWPGIYACDARNLLDIYVLTARARLAALDGDIRGAQASDGAVSPAECVTLSGPCPSAGAGAWFPQNSKKASASHAVAGGITETPNVQPRMFAPTPCKGGLHGVSAPQAASDGA